MILPVITLWEPWATWISLGWKTIETRTHSKFASLDGKLIGIHAGMKWDKNAIEVATPYLTKNQIISTKNFPRTSAGIIAVATVVDHRKLKKSDSKEALIDCGEVCRYGLFLTNIWPIMPMYAVSGKQGIWYADVPENIIGK